MNNAHFRTNRQQDEAVEAAIAAGERRYAASFADAEDYAAEARASRVRCADCGQPGERTGHMGCQYPQDRA